MTVAEQITDERLSELVAELDRYAGIADPTRLAEQRSLLTELQHRREAEAGAVAFIPQADLDRLARTGLSDCRLYREPTGSRFVVPLYAASPSSPASGKTPDTDMARHWIDRYAAGIDEEPQMSRILDALGVSALGEHP